MNTKIILAEEEPDVASQAQCCLSAEGYDVYRFNDGMHLLERVSELSLSCCREPWLAIISLRLPGGDGERVCRRLRAEYDWPIILVATRQDRFDALMTRRLGADDYLTKPYKAVELLGRVREQLNLYLHRLGLPVQPAPDMLRVRGLTLDRKARLCQVDERVVALTQTEFALLWELCLTPGKPVTAAELYRRIWREEYLDSAANTIMVHIRHLRVKLGDDANPEPYIRTVWREGYKVEP